MDSSVCGSETGTSVAPRASKRASAAFTASRTAGVRLSPRNSSGTPTRRPLSGMSALPPQSAAGTVARSSAGARRLVASRSSKPAMADSSSAQSAAERANTPA